MTCRLAQHGVFLLRGMLPASALLLLVACDPGPQLPGRYVLDGNTFAQQMSRALHKEGGIREGQERAAWGVLRKAEFELALYPDGTFVARQDFRAVDRLSELDGKDGKQPSKVDGKDGSGQTQSVGGARQGFDPGYIGAMPLAEVAPARSADEKRPGSDEKEPADGEDFKLFDESLVAGAGAHRPPQKPKVHRGFWTNEGMGRMTLERTTVDGKEDVEIWIATYVAGTLTIPLEDSGRDLNLRLNFRGDAPAPAPTPAKKR